MDCIELVRLEQRLAWLRAQRPTDAIRRELDEVNRIYKDHKIAHHSGLTSPKCGQC